MQEPIPTYDPHYQTRAVVQTKFLERTQNARCVQSAVKSDSLSNLILELTVHAVFNTQSQKKSAVFQLQFYLKTTKDGVNFFKYFVFIFKEKIKGLR